MTSAHIEELPTAGRRDWGRAAAWAMCLALAVVGLLPYAAVVVVRSPWVRAWATRQTERALREQGIVATYEMSLRVWPLAIELDHLRVDSTDGGTRAVECPRVRVRPKLFSLLAGKLAIDSVELDAPVVRLVMRDGAVAKPLRVCGGISRRAGTARSTCPSRRSR